MDFAIYETRIGKIRIEHEEDVLTKLTIVESSSQNRTSKFGDIVYRQICEYLDGKRFDFEINISPKGTDFQKRVWKELLNIPYGEVRSYKELACSLGNCNASRAVGMANNRNPIMIIIPCHRVVGASGDLIGYSGGLKMKKNLLDLESRQQHR